MKYALLLMNVLLLLTLCSCGDINNNSKVDKPYIESYQLLGEKCSLIIKEILEPAGIENDELFIREIYLLNIELDSSIYKETIYNEGFFVGVVFEPDSFDLQIFNIIPVVGEIYQCQSIENETKLIVNTGMALMNNMSKLKNNECIELNIDSYIHSLTKDKIGVWIKTNSTSMNGLWMKSAHNGNDFKNSLYNNNWYFGKKNQFALIEGKSDTIYQSQYVLESDDLFIEKTNDTFSIITQTNTVILIKQRNNEELHYLIKCEE